MITKLFVGNLSSDTMDDQLLEAFSEFGEVASATVVVDRDTGRSRGFGFVEFRAPESAAQALRSMDGATLGGCQLNVDEVRGRARR